MAIAIATLTTNIWDEIRSIINSDATVSSNATGVYSTYPQQFLDNSSLISSTKGIVIVHKPLVTEDKLTMQKKKLPVSIGIEIFAQNQASLKTLSDAVRNALETNKNSTKDLALFNFRIVGDTEDFYLRGKKRIHSCNLNIEYLWMGGGVL